MLGGYTNLNFAVFMVLAIGGAFLAFSVRRILNQIRRTERRIAAAVDEKNAAAADLRVARQQEEQLAAALAEGGTALRDIAQKTDEVQARMAVLRQAVPRPLNLISPAWVQGDQLFEAHLRAQGPRALDRRSGGPLRGLGEAGIVHGYAANEADFRTLVTHRLAAAGYTISGVLPIALADTAAALPLALPSPAQADAGDAPPSEAVEPPPARKSLPVRPPAVVAGPAPTG
ncbi:MAG: hypothetical protein PW843_17730 [Azospirillaceae bacterium]|nr:hypothetical protein [Azospirillaceae bacterium]